MRVIKNGLNKIRIEGTCNLNPLSIYYVQLSKIRTDDVDDDAMTNDESENTSS